MRGSQIIVPASGPLKPDGMKINPFPVIPSNNVLGPNLWSIHRLNLARSPILNCKVPKLKSWLKPHVGSMMSHRERTLRRKHKDDALMYVKDTIHSILIGASGTEGGPE